MSKVSALSERCLCLKKIYSLMKNSNLAGKKSFYWSVLSAWQGIAPRWGWPACPSPFLWRTPFSSVPAPAINRERQNLQDLCSCTTSLSTVRTYGKLKNLFETKYRKRGVWSTYTMVTSAIKNYSSQLVCTIVYAAFKIKPIQLHNNHSRPF